MGWEWMEDAEANFSEPIAFELIWKDDYKEFQYTEKAKVEKNCMSQCKKMLPFSAFYTLRGPYL